MSKPDLAELAIACNVAPDTVRHHLAEVLMSELIRDEPRVGRLAAAALVAAGDDYGKTLGRAVLGDRLDDRDFLDEIAKMPSVDILLLAVKEVELHAVLYAFELFNTAPMLVGRTGLCCWTTKRGDRTFAIAMVSTAGNTETAGVLFLLQQSLSFKTAVLVGMAAGVRDEVHLGDVVFSETVWAYEFERLTVGRAYSLVKPYPASDATLRGFSNWKASHLTWPDEVLSAALLLPETPFPEEEDERLDAWRPSQKRGGILAGSKLVENGKLPKKAQSVHGRALAAEMEGVGFAYACNELGLDWLVVRGIADYAEPDRRKHWQLYATFAAAKAVQAMSDRGFLFPAVFGTGRDGIDVR